MMVQPAAVLRPKRLGVLPRHWRRAAAQPRVAVSAGILILFALAVSGPIRKMSTFTSASLRHRSPIRSARTISGATFWCGSWKADACRCS
jgi:hypothetical protein